MEQTEKTVDIAATLARLAEWAEEHERQRMAATAERDNLIRFTLKYELLPRGAVERASGLGRNTVYRIEWAGMPCEVTDGYCTRHERPADKCVKNGLPRPIHDPRTGEAVQR